MLMKQGMFRNRFALTLVAAMAASLGQVVAARGQDTLGQATQSVDRMQQQLLDQVTGQTRTGVLTAVAAGKCPRRHSS